MSYLARLYDFAPNTLIESAKVDAEFNQLVNLVNGTTGTSGAKITYNASDVPTLLLDNTGGGKALAAAVAGVQKWFSNASGQIESVIATGTAPFVVASTTVVTNLNADKLDSYDVSGLGRLDKAWRLDAGNPTFLSLFRRSGGGPSATDEGVILEATSTSTFKLKWGQVTLTDPPTLSTVQDVATGTTTGASDGDFTFTWKPTWAADPSNDNHLTRKSWVAARVVPWTWGVFYSGSPVVGVRQPGYTVPSTITELKLTEVVYTVQDSSGTGTTTLKLYRRDSTGALYGGGGLLATVTINTNLVEYARQTLDVSPDVSLVAGDTLEWVVDAASADHKHISLWCHGTMKVV